MKKISLMIPTPCHEDWDKMTPEEKGRCCASCQKTVLDLTKMGDRELAEFFKKPVGSLCGVYFVQLIDKATGRSYTKKVTVQ